MCLLYTCTGILLSHCFFGHNEKRSKIGHRRASTVSTSIDIVDQEKCSGWRRPRKVQWSMSPKVTQKYKILKKKTYFKNLKINFSFWSTLAVDIKHCIYLGLLQAALFIMPVFFNIFFPFLSISMCLCFSVTIWTLEMSAVNPFCLSIFLNWTEKLSFAQ